jgi:hypothetical protein
VEDGGDAGNAGSAGFDQVEGDDTPIIYIETEAMKSCDPKPSFY